MPRFEPFRGTRFEAADLDVERVVAPPYDVLSPDDRTALGARDPHNIVHVDVPSGGVDRYERAAALLRAWLAEGALRDEVEPAFYLYRMSFTDPSGERRTTTGVVGAIEVVEPGGDVLPHEQTTPKDRSDRLELTRATAANLSPVWALSLGQGLADLLGPPGAHLATVHDDEGVAHSLELVDDPTRVEAIRAAVAEAPAVIADGHHRYEVARQYAAEQRAAHGEGPWDLTMAYVAPLVPEHLAVDAIHRLLVAPPGVDGLTVLSEHYVPKVLGLVGPSVTADMAAAGAVCFVQADGVGILLTPRPGAFDHVDDLDSARLAHALEGSGIEVHYQHGVERVLERVRKGEASWGVLLRPVTVAQIEDFAHRRALMPPKSTFFTPKLRTGLVVRRLQPS